jgi:DNA-directed RNA polymerase specialized sigma24 family protein
MTTRAHRNVTVRFVYPAHERELLEEFDDLVAAATRGDRRAIGAIAIALGPLLLREARIELGTTDDKESGDVLQELFTAMVEAALTFPPATGNALAWLKRTVRLFARAHVRHAGGG